MKKIISMLVVVGLMSAFFTGCGTNNGTSNGGTVATDGSTSMEKVIGYLSEAYMEENSDIKVTYNPTGSGSGIQAVLEGRCDIGLSSRDLKDEEKAELTGTVVAIDGIAVIVNPENPVADLTIEQIAGLYKGEITNWSEVGGADAPLFLSAEKLHQVQEMALNQSPIQKTFANILRNLHQQVMLCRQ